MHDLTAKRTLVKSPPELWSEVSEVERLARHLGAFGEITITKLVPEHTVAWEGEGASGTVSIEPSGWGTKVTLKAQLEAGAVEEPSPAEPEIEAPTPENAPMDETEPAPPISEALAVEAPEVEGAEIEESDAGPPDKLEPPELEPPPRRGFFARLFSRRTTPPVLAGDTRLARAAVKQEEAPAVEEPVVEEPVVDEPPVEEPSVEETPAEEPRAERPTVDEPSAVKLPPAPPGGQDGSPSLDPEHAQAVLDEALDTLGSAHHRPFSRG